MKRKAVNRKALSGKQITKRFVKFLSVVRSPTLFKSTVKAAPDQVIKTLCNAALTARKSNLQFGKGRLAKIKRNRTSIYKLTDPKIPLKKKRTILVQGGGFAWLPLILSTVLGTVGSALFNK